MGSLSGRNLVLAAPVEVETLWHRLAPTLPALVRIHAMHPHREDPLLMSRAPPEIRGPALEPDGKTRSYKCSENGVNGTLSLLAIERDGITHLSIVLTMIQRTVSFGMIVLSIWSQGDHPKAINGLGLEVTADLFPEVVAALAAAGVA